MNNDRLIELAIEGLKETKKRIDSELTDLLALAGITITTEAPAKAAKTSGRKPRTAAQKKAHSERMKKMWADKRKVKK